MTLLIDENISPRALPQIQVVFPNSVHVRELLLHSESDQKIWEYAKENNLVIVSKDSDFHHKSILYGSPPKVIWITIGNCTTNNIIDLILRNNIHIQKFIADLESSIMIL